ncbi:MAG: hypothetical protein LAT62_03595 [Natronospirillum sp.]|uniref:hypothetical protein n=1 Tax=Natronospirillum sp. TaxID=2812955 RepID=UPI0025E2CE96|nr:hypothetical protein [Natronospirillum sp.]MCH8550995.1 hypothetical protein [Natronospirillum sp.]
MTQQISDLDLSLDANNLYRDEVITDLRAGTLRQLTPVTVTGERDDSRAVRFHGQTQIMTQAGALPVNFDIDAKDLKEAVDKFGEAARKGMEDTIKQIEEMRREQASSIVVPGQEGGGLGGGQGGPGLKF